MKHFLIAASLLAVWVGVDRPVLATETRWVVPQGVTGQLQEDLRAAVRKQRLKVQSIDVRPDGVEVDMGREVRGETTLEFSIRRATNGPQLILQRGESTLFESLRKRIESSDLSYLFVELKETPKQTLPPPVRADNALEDAVSAIKNRWAGRSGHGPWVDESLPAEVSGLLDMLRTGDAEKALSEAKRRIQSPPFPAGVLSVYLAAGGDPPPHLDQAIRTHPLEPRLHTLRARQFMEAGRRELAAESLAAAMRLPLPDGAARDEAEKLGLRVADQWPKSLPSDTPTQPTDISLGWYGLFGLLALGLILLALRRRQWSTALVLLLGSTVSVATVAPVEDPILTVMPDVLLAPLAGGPCEDGVGRFTESGYAVDAMCAGRDLTFRVTRTKDVQEAFATTDEHQIHVEGVDLRAARTDVKQAAALLGEALAHAEREGFVVPNLGRNAPDTASVASRWSQLDPNARAELRIGAGVVACSVLMLILLLGQTLRLKLQSIRQPSRWVWLALGVCVCLYLVVPNRMLMVYSGYDRVASLAQGDIPRYGVSGLFFYGPWLWWGGIDHAWLQGLNRVLGLACLGVAWDLGRILLGMKRRELWFSAIALISMPLFIRGFTSEAISPFPTLCLLVALRLFAGPHPRNLPAAGVLLVCAAMGRPEIAAAVVCAPLWYVLSFPKRRREEAPWFLFGMLTLVVALQVARTLLVTEDLASREALPQASDPIGAAIHVLTFKSAHASIDYTPLGFIPLFLVGAWLGPRRRALALMGLAAVWLGATGIDLVRVSIPRLHIGPMLLLTPLVALGAGRVLDRARNRGPMVFRGAAGALATIWAAGLTLNALALFSPITEEGEEVLWRDTVEALPSTGGCLLRYGFGDPVPSPKTPLYSPDYLLPSGWKVDALSRLDPSKSVCQDALYVLLGTHCYTHLRPPGTPPPAGRGERPLCADIRARDDLRPIIEREVRHVGEPPGLRLFPEAENLPVGLYEVVR